MARKKCCLCIVVLILQCFPMSSSFFIVPEDVPTAFAAVFGFSPRLKFGNDHRFGFGFRFGNHADLQVLYELGPQTITGPLRTSRIREAPYVEQIRRRGPFLGLLLRAGILKDYSSYDFDVVHDDEPR